MNRPEFAPTDAKEFDSWMFDSVFSQFSVLDGFSTFERTISGRGPLILPQHGQGGDGGGNGRRGRNTRAGRFKMLPSATLSDEEAMSDVSLDLFDLESFTASSLYLTLYRGWGLPPKLDR